MKIGIIHSRIRRDEKLLLNEIRYRGHEVVKIDTRKLRLGLTEIQSDIETIPDIYLNRDVSQSRGLYTTRYLESYGEEVINSYGTSRVCSDKIETSLKLQENNIQTPETEVAFSRESALECIEEMGYPVVVKPVVGSWARLLAKINDRESAEAILEHKDLLGNYMHSVFYIQSFIDKPGRDIRVMAAGDNAPAAMYRSSEDWVTNAARGGDTSKCEVTREIEDIALRAADAVGEGVLGVDLMETEDGYTVHEINHTLEFKALTDASGVDVASEYMDYIEGYAG